MSILRTRMAIGFSLLIFSGTSLVILASCLEREKVIGIDEVDQSLSSGQPEQIIEGSTPIARILEAPAVYLNATVTVSGKVISQPAFEFVGEQPYIIQRGESMLHVITNTMVPPEGAFITVLGEIVAPYQIKGRHFDLVLLEKERQP